MDEFITDVQMMRVVCSEELLNKAAEAGLYQVKDELRHRFGVYPSWTGSFPKWHRLFYGTRWARIKQGYDEDAPLLREGWLRDSYQVDRDEAGRPQLSSGLPEAAVHELGDGRVPQRSTIGIAFEKREARAFDASMNYIRMRLASKGILLGMGSKEYAGGSSLIGGVGGASGVRLESMPAANHGGFKSSAFKS